MNRRIFAAFTGIMLCVIIFCGAGSVSRNGEAVYIGEHPGGLITYTDSDENYIYLATENSFFLLDSSGNRLGDIPVSGKIVYCTASGSSVCMVISADNTYYYEAYSLPDCQLVTPRINMSSSAGSHLFADNFCSAPDGTVYYSDGQTELKAFHPDSGSSLIFRLDKVITSICLVENQLYVSTGNISWKWDPSGPFTTDPSFSTPSSPVTFFSADLYVDTEGSLCSTDNVLYSTQFLSSPPNNVTQAFDGEYFYCQSGNHLVDSVDTNGTLTGRYQTDGNIAGICSEGVFTEKESKIYYSSFENLEMIISPASPEFSSPAVELPDNVDIINVDAGTSVSQFTNDTESKVYLDGVNVTSGHIRTGMTAEYGGRVYQLYISGDINGTGTVNSADFRKLQEHIIGKITLEGIWINAADISDNGVVGTEDLVLFMKKYKF